MLPAVVHPFYRMNIECMNYLSVPVGLRSLTSLLLELDLIFQYKKLPYSTSALKLAPWSTELKGLMKEATAGCSEHTTLVID